MNKPWLHVVFYIVYTYENDQTSISLPVGLETIDSESSFYDVTFCMYQSGLEIKTF